MPPGVALSARRRYATRIRTALLILLPLCTSLSRAQNGLGAIDVPLFDANPRAALTRYFALYGAQFGVTDTSEIGHDVVAMSKREWRCPEPTSPGCTRLAGVNRIYHGIPVLYEDLHLDFNDSTGAVGYVSGHWEAMDSATPYVPSITADSATASAIRRFARPLIRTAVDGLLLWRESNTVDFHLVWDIAVTGPGYVYGYLPPSNPMNGVPCDYVVGYYVDALTGQVIRGSAPNTGSSPGCADAFLRPTAVVESTGPSRFAIVSVAPNPFNPSTAIAFSLDRAYSSVALDVFDASGRRVRTLHRGSMDAGTHQVVWDGYDDGGRSCAAGAYVVRLSAEGRTSARRVVLAR